MELFGYSINFSREQGLVVQRANADGQEENEPRSTVFASFQDLAELWLPTDERKTIEDDIDRMANGDDYIAEALDILKSDCLPVRDFYEPIIGIDAEDEKLKAALEAIRDRSGLNENLSDLFIRIIKKGNCFGEFVLGKDKRFQNLQIIPQSWSVYRNIDRHGTLLAGDPADQKINNSAYDQRTDTGNFIAAWWPFEIIHFRCEPWDEKGYGIPFLLSARKNWLRLQYLEDAMAVARITRAYQKLVHKIPVPENIKTTKELTKYIKEYKKWLGQKQLNSVSDNMLKRSTMPYPREVTSDLFLPVNDKMKGDITALDPSNAQLQNLSDIEYFQNRLFARMKVPKARLANERDVNSKATLIIQNSAYASTIVGFQLTILRGLMEMFKTALFLEGYSEPDKLEFKITLPSPFVRDAKDQAEIENLEARTNDTLVKEGVVSRATARQLQMGWDKDRSAQEEEQIALEKESGIYSNPAPTFGLGAQEHKTDKAVLDSLYKVEKLLKGHNGKGGRLANC